jgi:23S rRNA (adenine-N6)-dimethyltransferase
MALQISHSQNFTNDPQLLDRLVVQSGITSDDLVVDIGAGHGEITRVLCNHCRAVVAIEKDQKLYNQLRLDFASQSNVTILNLDVLDYQFPTTSYKVFSNIPFNLTSDIVRHLSSQQNLAIDIFLFAQKEAANQFCGLPKESLKSLLLKPVYLPSVTYRFRRTDFRPVPRVDVVLLRFEKRASPLASLVEWRDFVVYVISQTQPNIFGTLKRIVTSAQLPKLTSRLGISPHSKPTDLIFDQWVGLYNFFSQSADIDIRSFVNGSYTKLLRQQQSLSKINRTRTDKSWREK